jgi:excisionase family DNA binding protein
MPTGPLAASPSTRKLLTLDEVADLFRVSKTSVYRLVERRALRFYRVSGLLRFDHTDIEAFLGAGCVEPVGNNQQNL